jgi:GGDEF domain-containing protein
MRAPASIIFDRRGDHVTGHVASPALNPSLIGPCIGCASEVAAAWVDLLNSPDGIVVDVASLPVALRVPAEDSGFVTLWVWPSRHDSHLSSVAWAIAWRNEPHLDIDQTRRQMMARLANLAGLIVDRAREDAAAKYAASHDALTGLLNRVEFSNRLNATISDGGGLTVLYLDLDGFKPINDRFGHGAGDVVLAEVARRMVRAVPAGAVVARLGGDEFFCAVRRRRRRRHRGRRSRWFDLLSPCGTDRARNATCPRGRKHRQCTTWSRWHHGRRAHRRRRSCPAAHETYPPR